MTRNSLFICALYNLSAQKYTRKVSFRVYSLIHRNHGLAAAAGDHFPLLHVEELPADGAVVIALFFCPDHGDQAPFFQLHAYLK